MDLSKEQLIALYDELGTYEKVGKHLGLTVSGIQHHMNKHGIKAKYHRRYNVNDHFFGEDTERSLYWAGFIAADGCIITNNECTTPTIVVLHLAVRDIDHLRQFKTDCQSESPITLSKDKSACYLKISSPTMVKELKDRFNITPRKTKTYVFPERLMNDPNVHHFIRGYVDADGCFSLNHGTKNALRPSLGFWLLGTEQFLSKAQRLISEAINNDRPNTIHQIPGTYRIGYGGNNATQAIADFLYREATIYLERKRAIVQEAKDMKPPATWKMNIDRAIEMIRLSASMSVKEISQHFDVSTNTVYDTISGKTQAGQKALAQIQIIDAEHNNLHQS
jgi:hypothetical protein